MKNFKLVLYIFISLAMINCGQDSYQHGKEAFASGQYKEAIDHLLKVQDERTKENSYSEMLSLAYMHHGEKLFQRTKNIDAFNGNFQKAKLVTPEEPTNEFKGKFSKLLFSLAGSYLKVKPENMIEKEKNIHCALNILDLATKYDSTNIEASNLRLETNQEYFRQMLAEANRYYDKARKEDRIELCLTAKDYLEKAAKYNSGHAEVKALSRKLNRSLLSVFDNTEGLALAITNYVRADNQFTMMLAIENYLQFSVMVDPKNFKLVDFKGNSYQIDEKEMHLFKYIGKKCLQHTKLDKNQPYTDGIVIFSVPKHVEISHLSYQHNDEEISRKYF